jgi:hypothetical protein
MTGIFLDQVAESNDGPSLAPVFRRLRDDIRRVDADAITVLNPGVAVPSAFADLADVIVTFEGTCDDYLADGPDAVFEPLSWQPGPDQAIWHVIHHTRTRTRRRSDRAQSPAKRRSGLRDRQRRREPVLVAALDRDLDTVQPDQRCRSHPSAPHWWPARRPRASRRYRPRSELMADSTLISNPTLSRRLHVVEAVAEFMVPSSSPRVFLASGAVMSRVGGRELAADRCGLDDREQPAVRLRRERHRLGLDPVGRSDVRSTRPTRCAGVSTLTGSASITTPTLRPCST